MWTIACMLILIEMGAGKAPSVTVRTLTGTLETGSLLELGSTGARVETGRPPAPKSFPIEDLLAIEFTGLGKSTRAAGPVRVLLDGGSLVSCIRFTTKDQKAWLGLSEDETWTIPLQNVRAVLLVPAEAKDLAEFVGKGISKRAVDGIDVLKEGKAYPLEGTLGDVHELDLLFTVDGDEIPVRRERLTALYYAPPNAPRAGEANARAEVTDLAESVWKVQELTWTGDALKLRIHDQLERDLRADEVKRIDFSPGRVVHLSDLEPTLVQHVPFFDVGWNYRRDVNFNGEPPRIQGQFFPKGLVVHSKTLIEYNLAGKYRRLEAMVGIEDSAGLFGDSLVRLKGDDMVLWEARLRAGEPARPVSIPLEKRSQLTIEVDFGEGLDVGDHVLFGDARLIK